MMKVSMFLLVLLAPHAMASECNSREKKKYEIMYCKSGTCTECCDSWCKSMCENLKASMENEECTCDTPPEAFTSDTYCDDKADDFHEKHKKDPFEAKMARACTMGCDGCCKHNKPDFLQVKNATLATVKAHTDSTAPNSPEKCNQCMVDAKFF